ncbi:hypothetical protein Bca4012_058643 [Brassica carinata]
MFYFFFESRKKKKDAPVVIWLTGGPGCSSECSMRTVLSRSIRICLLLGMSMDGTRFPISCMLTSLLELVSATPLTKVISVMTRRELAMIYMIFCRLSLMVVKIRA